MTDRGGTALLQPGDASEKPGLRPARSYHAAMESDDPLPLPDGGVDMPTPHEFTVSLPLDGLDSTVGIHEGQDGFSEAPMPPY